MTQYAIEVLGLGKRYRIGEMDPIRDMARRFRGLDPECFWALQDIDVKIEKGSVVGIVGHNGAGKSTLLKILSGITLPSMGLARIRGRVGSLLEVGTGFHPELTGRENIFFNGAILGMARGEILARFDEIVDFSGVETFLDTPVKRYSSGMYARLAFAVAAHLESEILLVDEVLAVGDLEFQKKCLGRMQDTARSGRTVMFVSHNIHSVRELCSVALRLEHGKLIDYGETEPVINRYLASSGQNLSVADGVEVCEGLIVQEMTIQPTLVKKNDSVKFKIVFHARTDVRLDRAVILLTNEYGVRTAIVDLPNVTRPKLSSGDEYVFEGSIDSLPLVEGRYVFGLHARGGWGVSTIPMERTIDVMRDRGDTLPFRSGVRGVVELEFSYESRLEKT